MAREVAAIATSLSVLEVSLAAIEYAALNHRGTEPRRFTEKGR